MWLSILLTVLALFFAYQGAMLSFSTPFASWTWMNVLVALFTVILLGIGIFDGIRAWQLWKIKAAKLNKAFEAEQEKAAAKRRTVYYDDTPDDPFAEGYVAKPSSKSDETDEDEEEGEALSSAEATPEATASVEENSALAPEEAPDEEKAKE